MNPFVPPQAPQDFPMAVDFVSYCLAQGGRSYQMNTGPMSPTSSRVAGAAMVQRALDKMGIQFPQFVLDQYKALVKAGTVVPVADALLFKGMLLFSTLPTQGGAYVAVSLGDGHSSIQTEDETYRIVVVSDTNFITAGMIPHLNYKDDPINF